MSQQGNDPTMRTRRKPEQAKNGAASEQNGNHGAEHGAPPARRHHRRPATTRGAQHAEAPESAAGPASAKTSAPTRTPARTPARTPTSPATRATGSGATDPAQAGDETGSTPGRAKAPTRRSPRRSGRAHAPQLVAPPRIASDDADAAAVAASPSLDIVTETGHQSAPAPRVVPVLSAPGHPAAGAHVAETTRAATAAAEALETEAPSFEAIIETLSPAEVTHALEQAGAVPVAPAPRRYRFDQRTRATPVPARRPERTSGAASAMGAMGATNGTAAGESASVVLPAALPAASITPVASTPVASGETATVEPPAATSADTAPPPAVSDELAVPPDWSSLATAGEHSSEAAQTPDAGLNGVVSADEPPSASTEEAVGEEGDEAAGTRKRRRRGRRGTATGTGVRHLEAVVGPEPSEPEPITPQSGGPNGEIEPYPLYGGAGGVSPAPRERGRADVYGGPDQPYQMYAPYQQPPNQQPPNQQPPNQQPPNQPEPWNIAQAQQQIGQPRSPFGAPEPNTVRGFGPQPQGVAGPATGRGVRGTRGERAADAPPMSANQLGAVLTQAIQQQTDRLLTEMRHTQAPPSMTVMFPPLPSTERVGVFVDVANLLYSSRSMRVALDFGRLLEFLRGNRRLVRAHAYAPTNPEPRAEQQFLTVVQGVGYRITTKNYKTFSSGAKKADLDLDMCMDIVRLVDAKAVDTIVLVSGDSDFLPLLEYCSDHGVRVEVAAFDDAAAAILRQSCDLFINLSLVDDIRG